MAWISLPGGKSGSHWRLSASIGGCYDWSYDVGLIRKICENGFVLRFDDGQCGGHCRPVIVP